MSNATETVTLNGTKWTRYDYGPDDTLWQRTCPVPTCHGGLLLTPVRYCSRCGGSGYVTQREAPAGLGLFEDETGNHE